VIWARFLPVELDNVATADTLNTKPVVIWRTYQSDDLTQRLQGPLTLEISILHLRTGLAPLMQKPLSLNNNRTGENYSIAKFPMLRGVMKT